MAWNAGAIVGTATIDDKGWNTGKLVKGVGALALAVGTTAVAAMTKATVSADKWQKSLSNVNTLVDESTVNSQAMAKSLLTLSPELGKTTELTDAMYQSFSSGAKTMDEALQTTTDAAMFAKAALTDTSTAVDVLTTAQNAYGAGVVSTQKASDIFFTTIKQGKINGEQLSGVIGQSIPLFASLGVPLEELGAGMAAMTKQGVQASETTTQLNAIMNAFLKPSGAMSKALEEQGYASGSALIESEGLTGALKFLESQTGGNKEALSELLPNVRAVRGALALTGTGGKEFTAIMEEMGTATGATQEAFGEQEKTIETLRASMNKVELVAGNIGKYFVDDIAKGATTAAEGMLQFVMSGSMAEIVGNLVGGVASAFTLLKEYSAPVVEQIFPAFRDIATTVADGLAELKGESEGNVGAFDILSSASQFAASGFKVLSVMAQGTIENIINLVKIVREAGQTLGSVGGLITGETKWRDVKDNLAETWDAVKNFGNEAKENAVDIFNTMGDEIVSFKDRVSAQTIEMETAVISSFTSQKQSVLLNWDEMITGQKSSFDQLTNTVTDGNEDMADSANDADSNIDSSTTGLIKNLSSAWKEHFKEVSAGFSDMFSMATEAGSSMLSGLTSITQLETQNQLDSVTLAYQEKQDALDAQLEAGIISQEQYDEQLEAMDAEKLAKENEVNKKAFETNKALQIAGIGMDTAKSIASWWSTAGQLGPIAGPIFAGVMTGATLGMSAKQIALVNEQQFVPARENGGMASGLTRINEAGGEIVSLPDGSQVIPNDISRQIAANSSGVINNTVNFTGPVYVRSEQDITAIANEVSRILGRELRIA